MSNSIAEALQLATAIRHEVDRDEERGLLYAAEYILKNAAASASTMTIDLPLAKKIVLQFVQHLLENDQFEASATILWGPEVYDWRPKAPVRWASHSMARLGFTWTGCAILTTPR